MVDDRGLDARERRHPYVLLALRLHAGTGRPRA
jgi:hypothetical protein